MDIRSKAPYPAGDLTNFAAYVFSVDDVDCASMEGFLQSLKKSDISEQADVCQLVGGKAKLWGVKHGNQWKETQTLWWKGVAYSREGEEYQELLDRAYQELFKNPKFQEALRATGTEVLTHSIGNPDIKDTVLTEFELCSRLMNLRNELS